MTALVPAYECAPACGRVFVAPNNDFRKNERQVTTARRVFWQRFFRLPPPAASHLSLSLMASRSSFDLKLTTAGSTPTTISQRTSSRRASLASFISLTQHHPG